MLRILILLAASVTVPFKAAVGQPAPVTARTSVVELPRPSGPFHVGKVTVRWLDTTRLEPLSATRDYRELMVDIRYPAEPSVGKPADYLDAAAFERALGASGFRQQFRAASDVVRAGLVQTHAVVGAQFSRSVARSPVVIFSPGGGMAREVYAAQLEELASHGYVVAAITHTYDGIVAVFPDGHTVTYDSKRWPEVPSVAGESNLNQLEWHTRDIAFVLDELDRANRPASAALPFRGRLDLSRVGAFGHSFGGIAAAHACQVDRRIKACMNQDGAVAFQPFPLDTRGWGMDQPFMLIERALDTPPPDDQALAEMKLTRQRLDELLARLRRGHDAALQSTGRGSYRVVLDSRKTTHSDFSDLPFLGARSPSEVDTRARILAVVRSWTLAFFDETLRGQKGRVLASTSPREFVDEVRRFGPAKRPW